MWTWSVFEAWTVKLDVGNLQRTNYSKLTENTFLLSYNGYFFFCYLLLRYIMNYILFFEIGNIALFVFHV